VPIAGGAPRSILDEVEFADWSPDGRLAVVRTVGGRCRLEFPIGNVIYDTNGWIGHPRFDPAGKSIALLDHPFLNDDRGSVVLVTVAGKSHRSLTRDSQASGAGVVAGWQEIIFSAEMATPRAIPPSP
jgi:hypothetical protein